MFNEILVTALVISLLELYRRTTYFRFDPKLSIIIIRANNGYLLLTYNTTFHFEHYATLENLWVYLVGQHRIYYFIDGVKPEKVVDQLMNQLHLYQVEQLFHYHIYWENKSLVHYMMKKNILLHNSSYPNFYSLVVDKKWKCFGIVTNLMWDEFDVIFDKISPESYDCVLDLSRILRYRKILDYNPKIKKYVENHNLETMKKIEPFMNHKRLPLDVCKLVATYLLY